MELNTLNDSSPRPVTPENSFIRPRGFVKRLKRLRLKTKSLTEEVDGNYNSLTPYSPEPLSLQNFDSTTICNPSTPMIQENEEEEYFKCCSPFETSDEEKVKQIVSDLVNYSFEKKRHSPKNEERHSHVSIRVDDVTSAATEDSTPTRCDDSEVDFGSQLKKIRCSQLLEDIEQALPELYSLKRTLYCPYTISTYRSMLRLNKVPSGEVNSRISSNQVPAITSVNNELERLKVELIVQKTLLEQSRKALASPFLSKERQREYLEVEKALLLACVKHDAVESELARLYRTNDDDILKQPKSGLANIKEIVIAVENPLSWASYYFICIAVEGDNVKCTSLECASNDGNIYFQNQLHFVNLTTNFIIHIFIYGINMKDVRPKGISKSNDLFNLSQSRSNSSTNLRHNFVLLGSSEVNLTHINNVDLILLTKEQKLGHSIKLHLKGDAFFPEHLNEGFLDVMRILGENGEKRLPWHRKWYTLTGMKLQGWNYPSQQDSLPPSEVIAIIDCVSSKAVPVNPYECLRPNTFMIETVNQEERCKLLCSADSKDAMLNWCRQINNAIEIFRKWKM